MQTVMPPASAMRPTPFQKPMSSGVGNASVWAPVGAAQPKFEGGALFNVLSSFDFIEAGKSTVLHNQMIYGSCIASRLVAAASRSGNEVWEHAVRDVMGWGFWFYATPMLHRILLKSFAPKDIKDLVIQKNQPPTATGVLGKLKWLNWQINPLSRWNISTTNQLNQRLEQSLTMLRSHYATPETQALTKAREVLSQALAHEEQASAGLLTKVRNSLLGSSGGAPLLNPEQQTAVESAFGAAGKELKGKQGSFFAQLHQTVKEEAKRSALSEAEQLLSAKDRILLSLNKTAQSKVPTDSSLHRLLNAETLIKASYQKAAKSRNLVAGVGLVLAVALLGFGIPLYNIYTTKKKMANGQKPQDPVQNDWSPVGFQQAGPGNRPINRYEAQSVSYPAYATQPR